MLSALFLVVADAEPLLDAVRGLPGVDLLEPAHISLGYPWLADAADRVEQVVAAAASVRAGAVDLIGPELFVQDVRRRTVVHATLSDDAVPRALADLLEAPLRTAHLSIARVRQAGDPAHVAAVVAPHLPLRVRLTELALTVREPNGWTTLVRAPLGAPVSGPREGAAPSDR